MGLSKPTHGWQHDTVSESATSYGVEELRFGWERLCLWWSRCQIGTEEAVVARAKGSGRRRRKAGGAAPCSNFQVRCRVRPSLWRSRVRASLSLSRLADLGGAGIRERKGSRRGLGWNASSAEAPKARSSSGRCSRRTASQILEANGEGEGEEGEPARIEGEGEKTTYLTRRGAATLRRRRCLAVVVPRATVKLAAAAGEEEEALKRSTRGAPVKEGCRIRVRWRRGRGSTAAGAWERGGAAESAETEAVRQHAEKARDAPGRRCGGRCGSGGLEATEASRTERRCGELFGGRFFFLTRTTSPVARSGGGQ